MNNELVFTTIVSDVSKFLARMDDVYMDRLAKERKTHPSLTCIYNVRTMAEKAWANVSAGEEKRYRQR